MGWDKYYEKISLGPLMWFSRDDITEISRTHRVSHPFAEFLWRRTEHSVRTIELAEITAGKSILEVGCGTGSFTAALILANQGKSYSIVATDYSAEGVRAASLRLKQLGLKGCSLIVADILALPFRQDAFDMVIAPSVIEHVPQQRQAMSEMVRVCKDRVIISTDNSYGELGSLGLGTFMALGGKVLRKLRVLPESQVCFISNKPQEFRRMAEGAGLDIEVFEFTHFSIPFFKTVLSLNKYLPSYCQNWLYKALSYLESRSGNSRFGWLHPMFIVVAAKRRLNHGVTASSGAWE